MAITVSGFYASLFAYAAGDGAGDIWLTQHGDGSTRTYTPGYIKTKLVTNSLTPFFRTEVNGLGAAYTNNEVSGTGYTAGGENFPQSAVGQGQEDRPPDGIQPFFGMYVYTFAGTPDPWVQWTNATITNARAAVTYMPGAAASNLICLHDFGGDYSVSNGTFRVHWANSYLFKYWTNGST